MRIVSYNVNGIRAALRKGLDAWVNDFNADVYCFQEIKANVEDIDHQVFESLGYPYMYWFPAQKKGYSGVGMISKHPLENVNTRSPLELANQEGRILECEVKGIHIINTYFPSGSSGDARQDIKMEFLEAYLPYAKGKLKSWENLLILGDYNICHKPIDIHDPVSNKKSSGFLPEEREWMDRFFDLGFTDSFRHIHPDPHQYTWWSYRANARANNKGWRIDYISANQKMNHRIKQSGILPDARHSDHCPIFIDLK